MTVPFGKAGSRCVSTLALLFTATTVPDVHAHHSIAGVYDRNRPVTIDALIVQFRFVNPHPFLEVETTDDSGQRQRWHLEMDNRGELSAVGVSERTFAAGDRVTVTGSLARSGANALYVRKLVRKTDGLVYEQVGSSPRLHREPPG